MREGESNTTNKTLEIPIERELSLAEKLEISEAKNRKLEVENEELKKELEDKKKKLEDMKELFLGIAHDLKGPISTTTVFIELLSENIKDGSITMEELINNLDVICKSNKTTEKLLGDLLTWGKLQLDGIKPEISVMNLTEEVKNSVDSLLLAIEKKEIKFENKIPDNVDILADSFMIQTVIRNLVSNAIKFTNRGGNISISCEKKNNLLEIYIKDDGVGLSEDQKKNLLESIGVSTLGTNKEKGNGLGLSICEDMIEKMGGTFKVESDGKDKGTKFIVTLPEGEKAR